MPTLVLKLLMHSRLQAGQCTQQHTDRIKPSHQYNGSEAEIQAFSTLASINKIWVEYLLLLGTNTHSQDRGMAKNKALFFHPHQPCKGSSPRRSHFEFLGLPKCLFKLSSRGKILSNQFYYDYYFKHRLIPRQKKHTLHGNIYRTITLPDGIILSRINFTHDVFKVLKCHNFC